MEGLARSCGDPSHMDLSGERGRVSEPWEQVERDLNEFPARQKGWGWGERIDGFCIFGQLPLIFLSLLICMVHLERLRKSISTEMRFILCRSC